MRNNKVKIIITIVIAVLIFIPGCSSKNNEKQSKKLVTGTSQKPPEELKKLITGIEEIITDLGKMIAMNQPDQKIMSSDTESNKNKEQTKNSGSNNSQNNQAKSKQSTNPADQKNQMWQPLNAKLIELHKDWNKLESEAIKAGLSVTERKNFKTALEDLSIEIGKKNEMNSLKAAVELYGQYASLAKVFKSNVPADYYKTKYEVMAASIEALEGKWDKAGERMTRLKDNWNSFKVQAKVKDKKLLNRSDLSMDDFEAAVAGKNKELLIIKAQIVLSNLQQIEKSLAKSMNMQNK